MIRRILVTIAFMAALMACPSCSSEDPMTRQIKAAVSAQMKQYPESTLKDLYKNFFQDAFGPGHLMSTSSDARTNMAAYISSECREVVEDNSPCPLYESTGYVGRFYRVNLSAVEDGTIPFDVFLDAFVRSAEQFTLPPIDEWKVEWEKIESIIVSLNLNLPDFEKDSEGIHNLLTSGEYASHHSESYQNAYKPHYRLIEKSIFETELLPYLQK